MKQILWSDSVVLISSTWKNGWEHANNLLMLLMAELLLASCY